MMNHHKLYLQCKLVDSKLIEPISDTKAAKSVPEWPSDFRNMFLEIPAK